MFIPFWFHLICHISASFLSILGLNVFHSFYRNIVKKCFFFNIVYKRLLFRRANLPTEESIASDATKRKPAASSRKREAATPPLPLEPELPKRKPAKKPAAPAIPSRSPSPDPEIDFPKRKPAPPPKKSVRPAEVPPPVPPLDYPADFPKRKPAVVKSEPKPSTYKKTFFKSRGKPAPAMVMELPGKAEEAAQPTAEPPRVPPIVDPFKEEKSDKETPTVEEEIRKIVDEKPTRSKAKRATRSAKESSPPSLGSDLPSKPTVDDLDDNLEPPSRPADQDKSGKPAKSRDKSRPAAEVKPPLATTVKFKPIKTTTKTETSIQEKDAPKAANSSQEKIDPPPPAAVETPPLSSSQETAEPPSPPPRQEPELDFDFPARLPQRKPAPKPAAKVKSKGSICISKLLRHTNYLILHK